MWANLAAPARCAAPASVADGATVSDFERPKHGTNDSNGNIDTANAPRRLGNLIADITTRAPNALLVVATIIPVANTGTNAKVKTYNAALPALVSARAGAAKQVVLVNNYAAFALAVSYQTTLMSDSLHPKDAGDAAVGRSFFSVIPGLLPGA